ncbi:hypothetical protein MML48_7g00006978 [Holotrichia oblita]|uniref:Uncharacterized protein n=1 Tax=Holotrichia oblita TaxID=644536 RepID=A0ACB9SW55_HOLOL|nr:hypothetical protein MML48_7g00006978 [Holotrichia oblita]
MEDQENNNSLNDTNNSHERKQIYRNLLNEIEDIQDSNDVGLQTIKKVKNILSEANLLNDQCDIHERVTCPEEILLDSFLISQASDVLVKCTKAVNIFAANYEPLNFAEKIIDTIKTDETIEQMDFIKLLNDARCVIPNVIEYNFLYGTYDFTTVPQPKQKKEPVAANAKNDDENNDSVVFLNKVLQNEYVKNNNNPLKYYDFVIDSKSYSATVENMFYCSFLIRDGKAELQINSEGIPVIKPTPKKALKSFRLQEGSNTQMIMMIDMNEWNRLKSKQAGFIQRHKRSV